MSVPIKGTALEGRTARAAWRKKVVNWSLMEFSRTGSWWSVPHPVRQTQSTPDTRFRSHACRPGAPRQTCSCLSCVPCLCLSCPLPFLRFALDPVPDFLQAWCYRALCSEVRAHQGDPGPPTMASSTRLCPSVLSLPEPHWASAPESSLRPSEGLS